MKVLNLIKKIYVSNVMSNDPRFTFSRDKQESVLCKYDNPVDNIERSYFQYKCQYELLGKKKCFYQICAFFIFIYKWCTIKDKTYLHDNCGLLCFLAGVGEDTVPSELRKLYETVRFYASDGKELLNKADRQWFKKNIVKRYPFDFFFQLKILLRLSSYSYMINSFGPNAIATHSEYSCGSSAMTAYCHSKKVKHFNFMHGEKIWYIRDSFFCYDQCYVWDEHYKKLFTSLKAEPNQFVIAIPPKFLVSKSNEFIIDNSLNKVDYCYYLANESHEQLDIIFEYLEKLKDCGKSVRIRMHPRWGDHIYIIKKAKADQINVENLDIDINQSILTTRNAISLFSTVLYQSYILNVPIIIDDVSSPGHFRCIQKLEYIAFSLPHKLLSQLTDKI